MNGPKKCLNCGSKNLIGPYKYYGAAVYITFFTNVVQQAHICVDCGYTMLFTRKGDEYKVNREQDSQRRKSYEE